MTKFKIKQDAEMAFSRQKTIFKDEDDENHKVIIN